ncbi:hypothetical protein GCM10025298_23410 [Natronobiforma cellulositropha]
MVMSHITRRHLLAVIGITPAAGCIDSLPVGSTGVPLGSILISNATDEPQSVRLQLQRADESVYDDTIEVSENEYEIIDPTWSSEPSRYRLECTTDDESRELSLPEDTEVENCNYVVIYFDSYIDFDIQVYDTPPNNEMVC